MSKLEYILKNKTPFKSVWFMRQAGRYLPEFRKIRKKNKNFINLCLNSKLASKITLQPIKRFDLDSAIIFSDILLVPYALGQDVNFTKGQGPHLSRFDQNIFLKNTKKIFINKLNPVYKAIKTTRKNLNKKKSLISFVGAPWTLLVYMLGLKNNKSKIDIIKLQNKKKQIEKILEELIKYLCIHIENQIKAGANVVQIFDSWAGLIPKKELYNYCFKPNLKIVQFCKAKKIPCICFPKGIKKSYENFNNIVKPDGINIDYDIDPKWAKSKIKNTVIQGGLNPKFLLNSDSRMKREAIKYMKTFKDTPYIFNLGHGLLPETDPDKVRKLIKFYREY